ncbi:TniQ family protein [Sagittula sp. SSi028]|uniref:TniQ family protein n=1 Tax=Sagittula sp. SSi028 TaxID=3400636 RepID=UPI003AF90115
MALYPHIAIDPRETVLSYAARLAVIHTGMGIDRLLPDLGLRIEDLVLGKLDALDVFAGGVGVPVTDLIPSNLQAFGKDAIFRGEACQWSFIARNADKYCPVCLAEDGGPRDWKQRLIWCFAPVQRCACHGVWLERLPASTRTLQEALGTTDDFDVPRPTGTPTPGYLSWLQGRLEGTVEDDPWLAGQGLQQILDAALMLGVVMAEGHKVAPKTLPPERSEAAVETGFQIYAQGPKAVTKALDLIRETSPAQAAQAGPLAKYGKLYDWLDRQCNGRDPGPIRDLLREHIIEHDVLDVGAKILGHEIEFRRFHSVQSLGDTLGRKSIQMARILKKLGRIPADTTAEEWNRIRFDATEISALVADFETAIPLEDLADYIGASFSQARTLYSEGIVKPLIPADKPGAVRNVVFARRTLDAFLARIAALPLAEGKDLHPISYVCQRKAGTTAEIVKAVLASELPAFRNPKSTGLASVVMPVDEVLAIRAA